MAADDEDNEVDGDGATGDGATGDGATGDYGDDDDAKNGGDADEARSADEEYYVFLAVCCVLCL